MCVDFLSVLVQIQWYLLFFAVGFGSGKNRFPFVHFSFAGYNSYVGTPRCMYFHTQEHFCARQVTSRIQRTGMNIQR